MNKWKKTSFNFVFFSLVALKLFIYTTNIMLDHRCLHMFIDLQIEDELNGFKWERKMDFVNCCRPTRKTFNGISHSLYQSMQQTIATIDVRERVKLKERLEEMQKKNTHFFSSRIC